MSKQVCTNLGGQLYILQKDGFVCNLKLFNKEMNLIV